MLKKNNLRGPEIFLEEFKSFNKKEILNNKSIKLLSSEQVKPFILKTNKSPIKTISYIKNDSGKIRHFTPAAQEWYNSIYSYNKNYIKLLPSADKSVMKLLRSYFNFFVSHKILKAKRVANKDRKLSANKVFVGKGELKHTNNKVVVTSYIYNAEQLYLKSLFRREAKSFYYTNIKLKKVDIDSLDKKNKYNRPFTLREYLNLYNNSNLSNSYKLHNDVCFKIFWKQYIKLVGMKKLKNEEKKKLKDQIQILFIREFHNINIHDSTTYNKFLNLLLNLIEEKNEKKLNEFKKQVLSVRKLHARFDFYLYIAKENFLKKLKRIAYLLMINTVKFKTPFVSKLLNFLKNIYKKNVELNIVNLNKMHLNSDIYTQLVSLKLKNRDNKLFRVLRWSLNKVNLPNVSRIAERKNTSNRDEYLVNKIRNTYINTMFNNNNNIKTDPLNKLLLGFFSSIYNLEINIKKRSSTIKRSISLYKYIIKSLKHLKLAGIRVEAKGRLTRRFTASRSVFKMKWKGGLKNVDSSFKGLSAIMLRGDRKSNVQYSLINSKNRNGAYGVKGWVSSK